MKRDTLIFGSLICLVIMILVGGSSYAESEEDSAGFHGTWLKTYVGGDAEVKGKRFGR